MKLCSITGCQSKHAGLGYCVKHYKRFKKYGDPNYKVKQYNRNPDPVCTIEGCSKVHLARGYCRMHYTRWYDKGDANAYSKNMPNTYRTYSDHTEIDLRNKSGTIVGIAMIDNSDTSEVLKHRWCIDSAGYAIGNVNRKLTRMHKLIMDFPYTDHKDRDRLNNRRENLRSSTHAQNTRNHAGSAKTSKYKGVSWAKNKYWAVYAKFPKSKGRFWGYYETEIEAVNAYNTFALRYGDEFTYLNTLPSEEI